MPIGLNNDTFNVNLSDELVQQVGSIIASTRHLPPTGYLLCDGSNTVSRTTYSNLFNVIVPNKGTVTITVATPGVVTLNSHGFLTGESIFLTTTGALPTGLSVDTLYFVISVDGNTFRLATSYANAIAGTSITTSGTQSGTHTLFYCPYGLGSTTSNFRLPDLKNATIRGRGSSTGFTPGNNLTTRLGFLEEDAFQGFYTRNSENNYSEARSSGSGSGHLVMASSLAVNEQTYVLGIPVNSGFGTPRTTHETRMKNQGVNFFIKF